MAYVLKTSQVVSNSRAPLLIGPFVGAEIMVKLVNTVSGDLERFEDDGFLIRWEIGDRIGRRQKLWFGETEVLLDVPQTGYSLRLFPTRYIFNYAVEVYEMAIAADLADLALKTGASESFLKLQSSQAIQLLEGLYKTSWIPAQLQNGFMDLGYGYQSMRYALRNGLVHVQGACTRTWPIPVDTTIFQLPAGMLPSNRISLPINGRSNGSENDFRVDVLPDGRVVMVGLASAGNCYPIMSSSFIPA